MAEAAKKQAESSYLQAVVSLLALIGLIGTLIYSKRGTDAAINAAKVAKRHMVASERPWVELVAIRVDGPLLFEEPPEAGDAYISVVLHLKNRGKSPALRIRTHLRLTIRNTENLVRQQRQFAQETLESIRSEMEAPDAPAFEHALFQDRELQTIRATAWMCADDIRRYREWADGMAEPPDIRAGVIGCITYESAIDDEFHQTGVIRNLCFYQGHDNTDAPIELRAIYLKETLSLTKSEVGTGAIT